MIRVSTPADADRLAEVSLHSWQAAYRGLLPQPYLDGLKLEDRRRTWYRNLASTSLASFLSEEQGRVQGYVNLWPDRSDSEAMEITAIYVHPDYWRAGIGSLLMDRALAYLAGSGSSRASLWVLEDNSRARAFYERAGFVPSGQLRQDRSFGGVTVRELQYRIDGLDS